MYQILKKQTLNVNTKLMVIHAPHVARKAEPGQFIILRVSAEGERIPLTIADFDRKNGTITIIFQEVGATTQALNEGDCLHDFVGPLGKESEFDGFKKVAVVGGGLGCAIAYPQAKKLHEMGVEVDLIAGFRSKDIIILEDEMKNACTNLHIVTDDGSNGRKALVTQVLKELIDAGNQYDAVLPLAARPSSRALTARISTATSSISTVQCAAAPCTRHRKRLLSRAARSTATCTRWRSSNHAEYESEKVPDA